MSDPPRTNAYTKTKEVFCGIHGYIQLTPTAQRFTDTVEFQRLGLIKQLGASSFVFSGADHTRKAHSLGCYHLARRIALRLQSVYGRERVDDRTVELVGLAALLHDVGHGCFSHIFDTIVASQSTTPLAHHEARSIHITRIMVTKYQIPLTEPEVDRVCRMINPGVGVGVPWFESIVSGVVDADRMDYLLRDSRNTGVATPVSVHSVDHIIQHMFIRGDGTLGLDPKVLRDVEELFRARRFMHVHVYQHRVSVSIECMLQDIFALVEDTHHLCSAVHDHDRFLSLNDSLLTGLFFDPRTPPAAVAVLGRLWSRDFYQTVFVRDFAAAVDTTSLVAELLLGGRGVVRARWLGMAVGPVHPLSLVFGDSLAGESPRAEREPHRVFRVSVIARSADPAAAEELGRTLVAQGVWPLSLPPGLL